MICNNSVYVCISKVGLFNSWFQNLYDTFCLTICRWLVRCSSTVQYSIAGAILFQFCNGELGPIFWHNNSGQTMPAEDVTQGGHSCFSWCNWHFDYLWKFTVSIYYHKVHTARDWPCKIHMNARPRSSWKGPRMNFNWGRIWSHRLASATWRNRIHVGPPHIRLCQSFHSRDPGWVSCSSCNTFSLSDGGTITEHPMISNHAVYLTRLVLS